MADLLFAQSSLHEETTRLGEALLVLSADDKQRQEEIAELNELLARVKRHSLGSRPSPYKVLGGTVVGMRNVQARGTIWCAQTSLKLPACTQATQRSPSHSFARSDAASSGMSRGLSGARSAAPSQADPLCAGPAEAVELSPGGPTAVPRMVESGLGALSSANKTLSAFQTQVWAKLTELPWDEQRVCMDTELSDLTLVHAKRSCTKARRPVSPPPAAQLGPESTAAASRPGAAGWVQRAGARGHAAAAGVAGEARHHGRSGSSTGTCGARRRG